MTLVTNQRPARLRKASKRVAALGNASSDPKVIYKFGINKDAGKNFIREEDAEKVGLVLVQIEKRDGKVASRTLVHEAMTPGGLLYDLNQQRGYIELDDAKAADNYRVWQAQHIIRTITVEVQVGETKEYRPAFENVNTGDEQGYRSLGEIVEDPVLMAQVTDRLRRELARINREYAWFTRFPSFAQEFGTTLDTIKTAAERREA